MTATATEDAESGPVFYFFDETSGNPGGTDSEWQSSATYVDTGLVVGTSYTYRVKARDSGVPTATTYSAESSGCDDSGVHKEFGEDGWQ